MMEVWVSVTPICSICTPTSPRTRFRRALLVSTFDVQEPAALADRVVEYFKKTLAERIKKPWVEVGCHIVAGSPTTSAQKDIEAFVRIAQRRLAQDFLARPISGQVRSSASPWCKDLSLDVSVDVAAIASAEWSIKADAIEVRPIVKVTKPEREAGPVACRLPT